MDAFLESIIIYSERGNVNINKNMFMVPEKNTIYLIRSIFDNITDNIFTKTIKTKYSFENYMEAEKNIDKEISDFILMDNIHSNNMLVENNILRLCYF